MGVFLIFSLVFTVFQLIWISFFVSKLPIQYLFSRNWSLKLNELIKCFMQVIKDGSLLCIHSAVLNCVKIFFKQSNSSSIVLDSGFVDDIILWCCSDLMDACSYNSAHLLSLVVTLFRSVHALSLNHVMSTLLEFLKKSFKLSVNLNKPAFINNLGWAIHLLRWFLVDIFVTQSDWLQVSKLLNAIIPSLFVFLTRQRSLMAALANRVDDVTTPLGCRPLDQYKSSSSSNLQQIHDPMWSIYMEESTDALVPTISYPLVGQVKTNRQWMHSSQHEPSPLNYRQQLPKGLLHPSQFFLVEPMPELFHSADHLNRTMHRAEEISVIDEVFSLHHWLTVFAHHRLSQSPQSCPDFESQSIMLRYLTQQWVSIVTRIGFQNDATCWKQIRDLRCYFRLIGALLLLVYDAPEHPDSTVQNQSLRRLVRELLDGNSHSPVETNAAKRLRFDETLPLDDQLKDETDLWGVLIDQATSDGPCGYLWWLVLDWSIRLKWQHLIAQQSTLEMVSIMNRLFGRLSMVSMRTVRTFANMLLSWHDVSQRRRREGLLSKSRLRNLDRLTCGALVELISLIDPPTQSAAAAFNSLCPSIAEQLHALFHKTDFLHSSCSGQLAPWRFRLLLAATQTFPQSLLTSSLQSTLQLPDSLMHNPALIFFIHEIFGQKQTDLLADVDDDASIIDPFLQQPSSSLLVGLHLACTAAFTPSVQCPLLGGHFNTSGLNSTQHARSTIRQLMQGIDFISHQCASHPVLSTETDITTAEAQAILLGIALQLAHIKSHLLNVSTASETMCPTIVANLLYRLLGNLLNKSNSQLKRAAPITRNEFTDHSGRSELLVAYITTALDCLSNQQQLDKPFWTELQCVQISEWLIQATETGYSIKSSSITATTASFGDDEFAECDVTTPAVETEEVFFDQTHVAASSDAADEETIRLCISYHVLSFALRTHNIPMVQSIQSRLGEVLSGSPCDTVDSITWLCSLVKLTSKAICESVNNCSLNPISWDAVWEDVVATLISCLVDAVREALKARLVRASRTSCCRPLLQLMRAQCHLVSCVVSVWRSESTNPIKDAARWRAIEQHLNQLIRTVWSVGGKRFNVGLAHGLDLATTETLQVWLEIQSTNLSNSTVCPESCLSITLHHSIPVVLFRLTDFLEGLIAATSAPNWTEPRASSLLLMINTLLSLLHQRPLALQVLSPNQSGDASLMTVYIHRLVHILLSRLSRIHCLLTPKRSSHGALRPEVDCLIQSCFQLTNVAKVPSSIVYELATDDYASSFTQNVRPYLIIAVLTKWMESEPPNSADPMDVLIKFPWSSWGLDDFEDASRQLSSELRCFLSSTPARTIKNTPCSQQLSIIDNQSTAYKLLVRIIYEESCAEPKLNSRMDWDFKRHASMLLEPEYLVKSIELLLRLLVLEPHTTMDTASPKEPNPLTLRLYQCLSQSAFRLGMVDARTMNLETFESLIHIVCSAWFCSKSTLPSRIEQLLELSVKLSPPSARWKGLTKKMAEENILFPRSARFACWTAIAELIIGILFHGKSPHSSSELWVQLKDFTFWRLVAGYLELLAAQLEASVFHFLPSLIRSFQFLLHHTQIHVHPDRDIQMEIALHHASVSHLTAVAMACLNSKQDPVDNLRKMLLPQVSNTLELLVTKSAASRFQTAICQLSNFPNHSFVGTTVYFAPLQRSLVGICTCDRSSQLKILQICAANLHLALPSQCPQLMRYRSWTFEEVNEILSTLYPVACASESKTDTFEDLMDLSQLTDPTQMCRRVADQLSTNSYDCLDLFTSLTERLNRLLSASEQLNDFRDTTAPLLTDPETKRVGLTCLSKLGFLVALFQYDHLSHTVTTSVGCFSQPTSPLLSSLDPSVKRWRECVLGLAHLASLAGSRSAALASSALRHMFAQSNPPMSSLASIESISPTDKNTPSMSTVLYPYLELLRVGQKSPKASEDRSELLNKIAQMSPNQLEQYATSQFDHYLQSCPETDDVEHAHRWLSGFLTWLVHLFGAHNNVYTTLKALFSLSMKLCEAIFPWVIVQLLTSSRDEPQATTLQPFYRALRKSIPASLAQSNTPCVIQSLWIDALSAVHCWEQWHRGGSSGSSSRSFEPVDLATSVWLLGADRAIALGRPHTAKLLLELAWLIDDCPVNWLASHAQTRLIWLRLCRAFSDSCGLQAARIAFLSPLSEDDDSHISGGIVDFPIEPNTIHTSSRGNQSFQVPPSSSADASLCLSTRSPEELVQLRSSMAHRLSQWNALSSDPPYVKETLSSSSGSNLTRELIKAASEEDWAHVSIVAQEELCTQLSPKSTSILSIGSTLVHRSHSISHLIQMVNVAQSVCALTTANTKPSLHESGFTSILATLIKETVTQTQLMRLTANAEVTPSRNREESSSLHCTPSIAIVTSSLGLTAALIKKFTGPSHNHNHPLLFSNSYGALTNLFFNATDAAIDAGFMHGATQVWLDRARQCHVELTEALTAPGSPQIARMWRQLVLEQLTARLERSRGEHRLATSRLQFALTSVQSTVEQLNDQCTPSVRGNLLRCYVKSTSLLCSWLFESRTKSGADLLTNYLEPAMVIASRWKVHSDADALASVARFADAQFTVLDSYLSSSEFSTRRQLLAEAQQDVACLSDLGEKSRLLRLLQRQSAIEVEELETLTSDADCYLETALEAYARCLIESDAHDLKIYRLVSLWLSTVTDSVATVPSESSSRVRTINRIMAKNVPAIRADKFLSLVPQLTVRLSNPSSTNAPNEPGPQFQPIITQLVERIITTHPHHSAFVLLSLVNSKLDELYNSSSTTTVAAAAVATTLRTGGTRTGHKAPAKMEVDSENPQRCLPEQSSRIKAAQRMFARLVASKRDGDLFRQMQSLAEAYVEWANADVDKHRGSTADVALPSGCKLQRFVRNTRSRGAVERQSLDLVALPTGTTRIDQSGRYANSSVVRIASFSPTFRLAGGINMPKIITCLGTDGRTYRQLVKGRDDPRQDAVMQQVFRAANCLLIRRNCRQRSDSTIVASSESDISSRRGWLDADGGLRMRTYKVLPMAQRSGVIEWCEGTVPLGEWLAADRTGGHQRYRPKDMPPTQAKQRLATVRDRPPERRRVVFDELCQRIKPVLAHFFLEHFPDAPSWCRARYAYIRSLAVSSLIGYLVGLGDRHPHNLLLHRSSGELIHIDLGVAFDQGRLLPTPEMVPFRLTRDLVHALGPLGLESGFIPAAEAVLQELRNGGDMILTLLQVLLHDPLYSWSMTPAQLCALEARRADCAAVLSRSHSTALTDQTNVGTNRVETTNNGRSELGGKGTLPRGGSRESMNQLAERVLLSVRSKLEGRVTGNLAAASSDQRKCGGLDQLDVPGHVGLLIRAATDPSNLARMYFGWQAYL